MTEVADNLKDLTTEGIDLLEAKKEIVSNPIYKDLIIGKDGALTAMQIVLKGNDEYDQLINDRYEILDRLSSKEPDTIANKQLLNDDLKIQLLNTDANFNFEITKIKSISKDYYKINFVYIPQQESGLVNKLLFLKLQDFEEQLELFITAEIID